MILFFRWLSADLGKSFTREPARTHTCQVVLFQSYLKLKPSPTLLRGYGDGQLSPTVTQHPD
jgi:hypothetical protein